jgi:hypothetical protein
MRKKMAALKDGSAKISSMERMDVLGWEGERARNENNDEDEWKKNR